MLSETTSQARKVLSLADFSAPGLMVPRLKQRDTAGVISELSQVLQRNGCIADLLPFYHAALNQELLSDSALDCGIAFPHARLNGIRTSQFALGLLEKPICWGAKGTRQVGVVFLLSVPATDAANWLQLLARLARLAMEPDVLHRLTSATSAEEMVDALKTIRIY